MYFHIFHLIPRLPFYNSTLLFLFPLFKFFLLLLQLFLFLFFLLLTPSHPPLSLLNHLHRLQTVPHWPPHFNSSSQQMTASNLAVCLAPSLFHLSVGSSSGSSPLRRRPGSAPEQRDLHENMAAHQCLSLMIQQVRSLFIHQSCDSATTQSCTPGGCFYRPSVALVIP